jgi:hypothetical protein
MHLKDREVMSFSLISVDCKKLAVPEFRVGCVAPLLRSVVVQAAPEVNSLELWKRPQSQLG